MHSGNSIFSITPRPLDQSRTSQIQCEVIKATTHKNIKQTAEKDIGSTMWHDVMGLRLNIRSSVKKSTFIPWYIVLTKLKLSSSQNPQQKSVRKSEQGNAMEPRTMKIFSDTLHTEVGASWVKGVLLFLMYLSFNLLASKSGF
eukprot:TRINITY_DN1356_c0_g1_i2.p3 TRINITY_DN1356_c0_g1~~TRINITY_DN1356_c0_g1_i2.p3  ORF type:complete len:143 (-),score=1.16 TRINITY_DN1356_c0_g1_i2:527-955(-)